MHSRTHFLLPRICIYMIIPILNTADASINQLAKNSHRHLAPTKRQQQHKTKTHGNCNSPINSIPPQLCLGTAACEKRSWILHTQASFSNSSSRVCTPTEVRLIMCPTAHNQRSGLCLTPYTRVCAPHGPFTINVHSILRCNLALLFHLAT